MLAFVAHQLHRLSAAAAALALLAMLALAPVAQAQTAESTGPNYTVWNALAALAEDTLDNQGTTEEVLNAIRAEVVSMRSEFLSAQAAQRDRIAGLREQIAALGPVPEEGVAEAVEITGRRTELNRLLAERAHTVSLLAEDSRPTGRIIRRPDSQGHVIVTDRLG